MLSALECMKLLVPAGLHVQFTRLNLHMNESNDLVHLYWDVFRVINQTVSNGCMIWTPPFRGEDGRPVSNHASTHSYGSGAMRHIVSYKPEAVSIYNSFSACSGLMFTICDLLGLPYAKLMAKRLRYSDLKTGTGRYLTTIPLILLPELPNKLYFQMMSTVSNPMGLRAESDETKRLFINSVRGVPMELARTSQGAFKTLNETIKK